VKNSRVFELHNTCHYVFIVDEALVVREMRKFLLTDPKSLEISVSFKIRDIVKMCY